MELNAFDRKVPVPESFVGAVVEVDHCLFQRAWKRRSIDGVSMVVRGDDDLAMLHIFDRLIAAAMPVRQLEGFRAAR